jgi:DNA polymerase-3 subunit delta'
MHSVFESALTSGEIAGAYLIEGSEGWARAEAEDFLRVLFCEKGSACGACPSCRKIRAGFHPDILRIEPGGKSIRVEDIKESGLMEWISRKSFEGGYKAVVVPGADRMGEAVQNKLLKVVEEPPDKTVFLLCANAGKNILPTVLSRCIIIRMRGKDNETAVEDLRQRLSLSTMSARVLVKTAGYDLYAATELFARKYFETRESAFRAAKRLLTAKNRANSVILDLLMKYADNLDDVFLALQSYLRDILVYKNTADEGLVINADQILDIRELSMRLTSRKLVLVLKSLQDTDRKRKLCAGILKKLMLENMLFEILEVVLA